MAGGRPLKEAVRMNDDAIPKKDPKNAGKKLLTPKHNPLLDPPAHLNIMECGCWYEFKKEIPWLTTADATLVEMACKLRAVLVAGELDIKQYGALTRLVLQLRGTAMSVDRQPGARDNGADIVEGSIEDEMFG
jgi:hypothetical protein